MTDRLPVTDAPDIGPILDDGQQRDAYETEELLIVLSHYDLGVIQAIRPYKRGSRRSPKIRITTERGEYLLKRRGPGRDDPYRVAFAHEVQQCLADKKFPVAPLVLTRRSRQSLVRHGGTVYELFRYVRGRHFDQSVEQARISGKALGKLHAILNDYQPQFSPPAGTFHAVDGLDASIDRIPDAVCTVETGIDRQRLEKHCALLREFYHRASHLVEDAGWSTWPDCVVHGDWHPGNLLYRDGRLVGVVDFDSSRLAPRLFDLANATLQFSLQMGPIDQLDRWPEGLDIQRVCAVYKGYSQVCHVPVDRDERRALPWLAIEAMILESVIPIAATGSFSRIPGSQFLAMVRRKAEWMAQHADEMVEALARVEP